MNNETLSMLMPEFILIVTAVVVILAGAFLKSRVALPVIASTGIVAALCGLAQWSGLPTVPTDVLESGPLQIDGLAITMRWVAAILGLLLTMSVARSAERSQMAEVLGLLVLVTAGMMFVAGSGQLVLLLMGLELISIPTYALIFLGRKDHDSAEATVKYFFLSLLSSALLLLGLTMLFGVFGTLDLPSLARLAGPLETPPRALYVASVLLFAGLGFKLATVPFHFYAPDVYQAASNFNAGLLAVTPKVAGVIALARLAPILASVIPDFVWQLALVMAMLTMVIGNFCALWQTNLRRLLAYSSIAHAGYMLIGIAVVVASGANSPAVYNGMGATLLYLTVYAFASLGIFAILSELSTAEVEISSLTDVAGLARSHPWYASLLAVFLFSLAGIPPLAGFWGKLTLLGGAISVARAEAGTPLSGWFLATSVVAVISAAVGAAYYLRVIGVIYFGDLGSASPRVARAPGAGLAAAFVCAAVVIAVGVLPGWGVGHFEEVGRQISQPTFVTAAPVSSPLAATTIFGSGSDEPE